MDTLTSLRFDGNPANVMLTDAIRCPICMATVDFSADGVISAEPHPIGFDAIPSADLRLIPDVMSGVSSME